MRFVNLEEVQVLIHSAIEYNKLKANWQTVQELTEIAKGIDDCQFIEIPEVKDDDKTVQYIYTEVRE